MKKSHRGSGVRGEESELQGKSPRIMHGHCRLNYEFSNYCQVPERSTQLSFTLFRGEEGGEVLQDERGGLGVSLDFGFLLHCIFLC